MQISVNRSGVGPKILHFSQASSSCHTANPERALSQKTPGNDFLQCCEPALQCSLPLNFKTPSTDRRESEAQ